MKIYQHFYLTLVTLLLVATGANAQAKLPRLSPGAEVKQTVGTTDVTIKYMSPGVKGRKIWGGLEKFGKVWRAGAGPSTRISFSTDVKINGVEIKKGHYTIMLDLKDENNWEWIIAKKGNVFGWKEKDVAVRVKANLRKSNYNKERLTYYVSADADDKGTVSLRWEKVEASFSFTINIKKEVLASINKFARQADWFSLGMAGHQAVLNADKPKDFELADRLTNAALAMKENMLTCAWKALVLQKMGKVKEAKKMAKKAKEMYSKDKNVDLKNFFDNAVKPGLAGI